MRSMLRLALVLAALALPTTATADEPPPVPEGGLNFYYDSPCSDQETGEVGHCFLGRAIDGTIYMTFWQNEELMLIRRVLPDGGYETIWTKFSFNTI